MSEPPTSETPISETSTPATPLSDAGVAALIQAAIDASQHAYIPYSNYRVGAALHTPAGAVYGGCNVENASYPATICAERTALVKAISSGERAFDVLALVTQNGGSPCGVCRQMLYEFAPDLRVIIADLDGRIHHDIRLRDLLPMGFGRQDLPREV